jgi:ADP-ribosylglycohydrolase
LTDTSSKLVAITTAHRALIMARPLSTDQLDYGVRDELRKLTSPSALRTESLKPTGYTVDSLVCALWAFANHKTLKDTIIAAVNLGGDADTIGAIAGGLAGVYWGYEAIPDRWLEKFTPEQRARLDQAVEGLLEVRRLR